MLFYTKNVEATREEEGPENELGEGIMTRVLPHSIVSPFSNSFLVYHFSNITSYLFSYISGERGIDHTLSLSSLASLPWCPKALIACSESQATPSGLSVEIPIQEIWWYIFPGFSNVTSSCKVGSVMFQTSCSALPSTVTLADGSWNGMMTGKKGEEKWGGILKWFALFFISSSFKHVLKMIRESTLFLYIK